MCHCLTSSQKNIHVSIKQLQSWKHFICVYYHPYCKTNWSSLLHLFIILLYVLLITNWCWFVLFVYCIDKFVCLLLAVSTLVISYFRTRTVSTISTVMRHKNSSVEFIDFNLSILSLCVNFTHNCHAIFTHFLTLQKVLYYWPCRLLDMEKPSDWSSEATNNLSTQKPSYLFSVNSNLSKKKKNLSC